ncbi:MAG: purine-nucleoside phosphorylase [Planctomycetota bacterium]|jgi:purine-nucleoside phosphorylase
MDTLREATEFLAPKFEGKPSVGLVLGSGLGAVVDAVHDGIEISTTDIPHFPASGVSGHEGTLILGTLRGKRVAVLRGRVHMYEGYALSTIVFPVRVLAQLGVETLLLTNAAGAVDETFAPGDLMLITDHLNLMGANPLAGPNLDPLGPRFPDMSEVYDKGLRERARSVASAMGIPLRTGVYAAMAGPSYETPAEIRMLKTMGANAVGMSTVPEAIAARHAGLRVLAISMISNLAAGLSPTPLSHEEVLQTGAKAGRSLSRLIEGFVESM